MIVSDVNEEILLIIYYYACKTHLDALVADLGSFASESAPVDAAVQNMCSILQHLEKCLE